MYVEILEKYIKDYDWAKIQPPATIEQITQAEATVGFEFPRELRELLLETNGDHWFLMSCEEIIKHVEINRDILAEYFESRDEFAQRVDNHIFFATNGCGDYYCYSASASGNIDSSAIYIWEHEEFTCRKVADNIPELIHKYYTDQI